MPGAAPRSLTRKIALSLGSVLALLVLLELGFRAYDRFAQDLPFWWDPALAAKRQTRLCNPFLLFRGADQDWTRRGKTPEQVIEPNGRRVVRIVCLGGSTTQDVTAFEEGRITYPSELQRLLNESVSPGDNMVFEVINAGFAAHTTLHCLVLLQTEILPLKPDLIIVYENINDLLVNYFPGPTTPAYANKLLHSYYLPPEMSAERATWLDHSRLYSWARDRLRTVTQYGIQYTDEAIELKHADVFRTNLRNIAAIARANGIPVVFGQQALAADQRLFERHFKTKSFNPVVKYPRMEQLVRHFERYNAIVREVAAETGAPCADPYSVLKNRPDVFADVVHTNAAGARLVGREFGRVVIGSAWYREKTTAALRAAAKRGGP